jgi:glycosyltransferase involved in cell wall biosynthesis
MVAACPFPARRGTPIRIQRLAEALAGRGHEVHVVTYHLGDALDDPPYAIHRTRDVASYRRTSPGPSYRKLLVLDRLLVGALRKVLDAHPIDIIHAHHYEGLLVAGWATGGRARRSLPGSNGVRRMPPVIYDAHTTLESELPLYSLGLPAGFKRWIGRLLDARLPPRADHVVAVTEKIRESLVRSGLSADSISVVGNGVEAEAFHLTGPGALLEPGTRTVIFTGNLAAYQGIEHLLRAFAIVLGRSADSRLLIVSDSPFAPYEQLARDLGIQHALILKQSSFDGLPAHLASAEVAVNPRIDAAGVPVKLLNYMAAGKAIVSFAESAVHIEHERTGLCVPDGDIDAMAAAILRLLDDPALARRLGSAARKVAGHLSWEAAAAALEGIYERLLPGPEATELHGDDRRPSLTPSRAPRLR